MRLVSLLAAVTRSIELVTNKFLRRVFGMKLVRASNERPSGWNLNREPQFVTTQFIDNIALQHSPFVETFRVPLEKCVSLGGFVFLPGKHPFVNFFSNEPSLSRFYETFRPNDIFENHFCVRPAESEFPLTHIDGFQLIPYLSERQFLNARLADEEVESIHQFVGPISDKSLGFQSNRLKEVHDSISSRGLLGPPLVDLPNGTFIRRRQDFLFLVYDGNHRCAAISAITNGHFAPTFQLYPVYSPVIYVDHLAEPFRSLLDSYFDPEIQAKRHQLLSVL